MSINKNFSSLWEILSTPLFGVWPTSYSDLIFGIGEPLFGVWPTGPTVRPDLWERRAFIKINKCYIICKAVPAGCLAGRS